MRVEGGDGGVGVGQSLAVGGGVTVDDMKEPLFRVMYTEYVMVARSNRDRLKMIAMSFLSTEVEEGMMCFFGCFRMKRRYVTNRLPWWNKREKAGKHIALLFLKEDLAKNKKTKITFVRRHLPPNRRRKTGKFSS